MPRKKQTPEGPPPPPSDFTPTNTTATKATPSTATSRKLVLPYHYRPRHYQQNFWKAMLGGKTRACLVYHRRAGKDITAFNWMVYSAAQIRPGTYYYIFPTYGQGKRILWEGKDYAGNRILTHYIPEELVIQKHDTELKVELTYLPDPSKTSIIQIVGTDNADSVVGSNTVGCIFSEFSIQNPDAWNLTRPILRENGGWAVFVYTPRGKNHGYKLFEANKDNPNWFCELLTVRDTRRDDGKWVMSPADIEEERRSGMDEDLIQQEYFCSWEGSVQGNYYGSMLSLAEKEGRIAPLPISPNKPVITGWDIGIRDATAIWFIQENDPWIDAIDYLEMRGEGLHYYISELQKKPYVYGKHIGPHDIGYKDWVSGEARIEVARRLGIRFSVAKKLTVADGIDAVRRLLPRMRFHSLNCEKGLDALRSYHKIYDESKREFRAQPEHDWSSHGADALRYFAVGRTEQRKQGGLLQMPAVMDFDPYTYDKSRQSDDFNPYEYDEAI